MMEKNKDSFVLYTSFYEPISRLSYEQMGKLFKSIFMWQINGKAEPCEMDAETEMALRFIIHQFKIDNERYAARCEENKKNGKLGGRPKKTKRLLKNQAVFEKAKKPDNDNENENDNENGEISKRPTKEHFDFPYTSQEFIDTWNDLVSQPKWKRKSMSALQKNLDLLRPYDEPFAIELMNKSIANDWQGLTFPNTPKDYEQWKASHPKGGKIITSLKDFD